MGKICSLCHEDKGLSEFRKDKSRKDGFHPHCKTCQLKYRRKDPTNLVRIEGERRRHKEYNLRKNGFLTSEISAKEKASFHLKKYYKENPEAIEKKRDHFSQNKNFTLNPFHLKYQNSKGEKFRSSLEVEFSELLIENNIPYKYEVKFPLINKRLKVVDFLIDDCVIVEITGYAYEKWQKDFKGKLARNPTSL